VPRIVHHSVPQFLRLLRVSSFTYVHLITLVLTRPLLGALEVMEISSVENMMKFLDKSSANGWHVVGTALTPDATSVYEIPVGKPVVIVLGTRRFLLP